MDGKELRFQEKLDAKDDCESTFEDSIGSCLSSCSSDLMEDVTSSSSSSSSNGPLYELSELMAQLPIKRGLSKYYQGKSQTFTSLATVKSLEDLAKKRRPSKRTMKLCKSYEGGLDNHIFSPKAIISKKKNSRVSLPSPPRICRSRTVSPNFGVS